MDVLYGTRAELTECMGVGPEVVAPPGQGLARSLVEAGAEQQTLAVVVLPTPLTHLSSGWAHWGLA